jgi:hypothetical protein
MRLPVQLGQMLRLPQEKGDEQVMDTGVARKASKAPAEVPAGQECAELLLDVARQPSFVVLARVGEDAFEMLLDELV